MVVLVWRSTEVVCSTIKGQDLKWKSTDSENAEIGMLKSTDSEEHGDWNGTSSEKLSKNMHLYID